MHEVNERHLCRGPSPVAAILLVRQNWERATIYFGILWRGHSHAQFSEFLYCAQKPLQANFEVWRKLWCTVVCCRFLPVFNLFGPGKTALSNRMERYNFILLVLSAWISCCVAFYLPGLAPVSYCEPGKITNPACLVSVWESLHIYFLHLSVSPSVFSTITVLISGLISKLFQCAWLIAIYTWSTEATVFSLRLQCA